MSLMRLGGCLILLSTLAAVAAQEVVEPLREQRLVKLPGADASDDALRAEAIVNSMPDLLVRTFSNGGLDKRKWAKVSKFLWDYLLTNDHDYFDASGSVVPKAFAGVTAARSGPTVKCGRFARQWIRMPFHDCGTYSKFLKRYGCNGSLRKELPMTEPMLDYTRIAADGKSFVVKGGDVFDQFMVNGVRHAAVDIEVKPGKHNENAGMAASMAAFYAAKLYALSPEVGMTDISIADIIILAGNLGLARCDGPHVSFVPGRKDSVGADPEDLLPMPPPEDDYFHVLMYFLNNGMSELDAVVLLGSHTTACFQEGCLDSTPNKFDKQWAAEVLAYPTMKDIIPECQKLEKAPAVSRCKATMDTTWLEQAPTRQFLELMTNPAQDAVALSSAVSAVVDSLGMKNYDGLNYRANLCTSFTCPSYLENFAFFNLFASSWFRMITNNVPANQ